MIEWPLDIFTTRCIVHCKVHLFCFFFPLCMAIIWIPVAEGGKWLESICTFLNIFVFFLRLSCLLYPKELHFCIFGYVHTVFLAWIGSRSAWNTHVFGITSGICFQSAHKKLCTYPNSVTDGISFADDRCDYAFQFSKCLFLGILRSRQSTVFMARIRHCPKCEILIPVIKVRCPRT